MKIEERSAAWKSQTNDCDAERYFEPLLIQNWIQWTHSTLTNLESNHEVHLRGLMWKEPIKQWSWRRRSYSPNQKNQSQFVAPNILKWTELLGRCLMTMLCSKNYQVNTSFILLLRWMENPCYFKSWCDEFAALKWKKVIRETQTHSFTNQSKFSMAKHIRKTTIENL